MADYRQALSHGKTSLRQDRFLDLGGQLPVAWLRDLGGSVVIFFFVRILSATSRMFANVDGTRKAGELCSTKNQTSGSWVDHQSTGIATNCLRFGTATAGDLWGAASLGLCLFHLFQHWVRISFFYQERRGEQDGSRVVIREMVRYLT